VRVADYVAQFLVDNDITDAFSVVGGGAMHLNDALGHKEGLHVTYNHHEQACAIAAEGYARLTQRVAAVCVTTGPGGTNAITGVMGGWLDSIPMFVLSGQVKFTTTIASTDVPLRQLGDQEYNILDSVRPMTKYSVMVTDPSTIAYHLEKALYVATHGRPGPVWLDIPLNVQAAPIEGLTFSHFNPDEEDVLLDQESVKPVSREQIGKVVELVRAANAPVILAGAGIRTGRAYDEFLEAIDALQIPVCTAWNAHDLLPDDHPLYVGRPGTVGTRGGNFVIQNADLVISLACRMNIRQVSYNWENFAKNAKLVAVDIDSAELEKPTLSIDMPIHANIKDFLSELITLAPGSSLGEHAGWLAWCKAVDAKYPACLPEYRGEKTPVNIYVLMDELSKALPGGMVTVASNGAACVCGFQGMHVKKGQRLFTNSGCAAMGYGLPASVGAAIARKGEPVLCLEGDGSLMMNLQELETVSYNSLNLKLVILNNDGYQSIRQTQTNTFNSNYCGIDQDSGVGFPKWERIASAFEIPFVRIDSLDNLDGGIDMLLTTDGPVVCEAVVGKEQAFAPKLGARKLPDGSMVSPSLEDMSPFLSRDELTENVYTAMNSNEHGL
jgi:acetolactate synthase-1/2/3 large subunit